MQYDSNKISIKKRRAISNIIGSLIVLAIVASVGSVILFQGLNQINAFNYDLNVHNKERVNELRENLFLQNARFDSRPADPTKFNGTEIYLNIANTGSVDSTIASITVIKVDTQELIFYKYVPDADKATILIEDDTEITLSGATLGSSPNDIFNSTNYGGPPLNDPGPRYRLTIETAKGNFFPFEIAPWNT